MNAENKEKLKMIKSQLFSRHLAQIAELKLEMKFSLSDQAECVGSEDSCVLSGIK